MKCDQISDGTASWPETNFLTLARGETSNGRMLLPLAWDQRHSLTFDLGYQNPASGWLVNVLTQINGPATASNWLTNEEIDLPWRHDIALKVAAPFRWSGLRLEPYVEIYNLLNERYTTPGEGGLDLSQPLTQRTSGLGREIWMGITLR